MNNGKMKSHLTKNFTESHHDHVYGNSNITEVLERSNSQVLCQVIYPSADTTSLILNQPQNVYFVIQT